MRKALRWLLSLVVLIGTVSAAGAATAAQPQTAPQTQAQAQDDGAEADIKDRLLAIDGMRLIEEKPYPGYRFFVLGYTQPVDHKNPGKGTFEQRLTVLHKDTARPTVFFTSGYHVSTNPRRSEPTQIVDGNQVSLEYRFFSPSRPDPADWSKLDIQQAAADQHRLFEALKPIYSKKWLATGGSKGGMTATYYERFHPDDMDGVVAYVAPNDVVNNEDSAYDRFFETVGPKECREALQAVEREALVRREPMEKLYADYLAAGDYTVKTVGTLDKAFEATVLDTAWGFWQYSLEADCADVPEAAKVSDQELFDYIDTIAGWSAYTDQSLADYTPYYYQAGTQLGAPTIQQPHLEGLTRYGYQPPRNFVPRDIPMSFDPSTMRDVDSWVRQNAERMLFVYGQNDPWGSEPFRPGAGTEDSYVVTAPGANHGANVAGLVADEKAKATADILKWAGVAPAAVKSDPSKAKPLAAYDATLDKQDVRKGLRP
ncbi:S28 family serine protease [Streptomyces cavernicola]|uniref:S28 family serine protease n=1 Tax=Streptomyces cavernicola TaxID=3043613 RepID=A0ABT6S891_9ACTN|nr:S28 family serine protease [Streptomyces sp. B-S-A6]MDI3404315.1 S28 family serine protease [Streptomyces sp. B-S-A6]